MPADRLFDDYRRTGDPAVLGEVFDQVASDLFTVALHVAPDAAAAEDLVQQTFLAAMQHAARWDASRPLRAWLLGILHNMARRQRRNARREPPAERCVARTHPPPIQVVLAAETADAVAAAIAAMPQPYREVLELRLLEAMPNEAVAAKLARSPGVVRTQLWRGLEMLRRVLPKGLAQSLAAQLATEPGLAAVRARVVAAASNPQSSVGVAGAGLMSGVLLVNKLVLAAACVVAVAGVGWFAWPREPASPPPLAPSSVDPSSAAQALGEPAAEPLTDRHGAAPERVAADADAPPAPAAAVAAANDPWPEVVREARLLAVMETGEPVAGATVELFEPKRDPNSKSGYASPEEPTTRLDSSLRTDAEGRCTVPLEQSVLFVNVRHDDAGSSGCLLLSRRNWLLKEELRVVVRPPLWVSGVVLTADGEPAPGATVQVTSTLGSLSRIIPVPLPARTDEAGRFRVPMLPGAYTFRVRSHEESSEPCRIVVDTASAAREITLRLKGACSVRGLVLAPGGEPVSDAIVLLHPHAPAQPIAPGGPPSRPEPCVGRTGADGRFRIALTGPQRFTAVARKQGFANAHLEVEATAARPHADVTLQLREFERIAGRVVDEHGMPRPGGRVYATLPDAEPDELPAAWRLGTTDACDVGADGSFTLAVHPEGRYGVVLRPHPESANHLQKEDVAAGTTDLVFVVDSREAEGFRLFGRIVGPDGSAVPAFDVTVIRHDHDASKQGRVVGRKEVTDPEGRFAFDHLPCDGRYSVWAQARGTGKGQNYVPAAYAGTYAGPWDATGREREVLIRLPEWGHVVCRVTTADGQPAAHVPVALTVVGANWSNTFRMPQPTDGDGVLRTRAWPGRWRLTAKPGADPVTHVSTEVDLVAGREVEARLVLGQ